MCFRDSLTLRERRPNPEKWYDNLTNIEICNFSLHKDDFKTNYCSF